MGRRSVKGRLKSLIEALHAYQAESVYVFGSAAKGEADELSDLDVVVIKQTSAPFFERMLEIARLLPAEVGAVDLLVYTPEEFAAMRRDGNAFTEMVAEEGRLIYGRPAKV